MPSVSTNLKFCRLVKTLPCTRQQNFRPIHINSLPQNKFLDWCKFKALATDRINVTEKLKFVFGKLKTVREKEKMLITRIVSFSHSFQKVSSSGWLKVGTVGKELKA